MEHDIKVLKKALIIVSLYSVLMPIALQIFGHLMTLDPFRIKHITDFYYRAVILTIVTVIPNLIPILFSYGYLFKRNYTDVNYPWYLSGSYTSLAYVVISNTIFNVILFLQYFYHLKGKIWITIPVLGLFPLDSILLTLASYGIGFQIGKHRHKALTTNI